MEDKNKEFIIELRTDFLSDTEGSLQQLIDRSTKITHRLGEELPNVIKCIHDLKGQAQVVGFLKLVEYFHEFEGFLDAPDSGGQCTSMILSV